MYLKERTLPRGKRHIISIIFKRGISLWGGMKDA